MPATRINLETRAREQTVRVDFKVANGNLNTVIKALNSWGFTTFDIMDVLSTFTAPSALAKTSGLLARFWPSSRDRLSTFEIHTSIVASSHITFDHCFFVLVASAMSAVGLLTDSGVVILAAFFVSPLMNMIMAAVWGTVIGDAHLRQRGVLNMLAGGTIAFGFGVLLGGMLGMAGEKSSLFTPIRQGSGLFVGMSLDASEIRGRGPPTLSNWIKTSIIASLSGVTIALGQSTGVPNALAGVTLAVSLLPPLVNSGICLSIGLLHPDATTTDGFTYLQVSACSLGIYLVTVPAVMVFAWCTFKFKHIGGISFSVGDRKESERQLWASAGVKTEEQKAACQAVVAPVGRSICGGGSQVLELPETRYSSGSGSKYSDAAQTPVMVASSLPLGAS